ncbi:MAG TPA: helix-turn-helix domain-containing protein [Hyphomicrobiaceae bacterium]|nr:helix-turn-helix domain-containing protein [Hyphomicrobiaceae bacterium]
MPERTNGRRTGGAGKRDHSRRVAVPRQGAPRAPRASPEARRRAILDAALTVFAERGYEAARLDDIAARAGIAKGTLYLYFADKQALFEALIHSAVDPILEQLSAVAATPNLPLDKVLASLFTAFQQEVFGTKRKFLLRLMIAEGPRFPALAEFHYRNVVSRIMPLIAEAARRARERGELATDGLARFPQLVVAPLLVAVVWDALFAKFAPLDVAAMLEAHQRLLTGKAPRRRS